MAGAAGGRAGEHSGDGEGSKAYRVKSLSVPAKSNTITGATSMARRSKEWAALGLLPLRQHWQEINRQERAAKARQRTYRKTYTKRRPKCGCDAYKFPHRPGG